MQTQSRGAATERHRVDPERLGSATRGRLRGGSRWSARGADDGRAGVGRAGRRRGRRHRRGAGRPGPALHRRLLPAAAGAALGGPGPAGARRDRRGRGGRAAPRAPLRRPRPPAPRAPRRLRDRDLGQRRRRDPRHRSRRRPRRRRRPLRHPARKPRRRRQRHRPRRPARHGPRLGGPAAAADDRAGRLRRRGARRLGRLPLRRPARPESRSPRWSTSTPSARRSTRPAPSSPTPASPPFAAESAAATGWHVEQQLDARDFPYADHAPFIAAGIPAAWIWRYPPPHPYYHSSGDTLRWVNFTRLAEDATASAFTAFRLATTPAVDLR